MDKTQLEERERKIGNLPPGYVRTRKAADEIIERVRNDDLTVAEITDGLRNGVFDDIEVFRGRPDVKDGLLRRLEG